MNNLFKYVKKPALYEKSSFNFWDDLTISKHLLQAHLDPDIEAASRSHSFIEQSVEFIANQFPKSIYPTILDLGCGPGLYAQKLAKEGYQVTGVDFSKRSIAYAKQQAKMENLAINYKYLDYLTLDIENEFDVVLMIYCDYAVLSDGDRKRLLQLVSKALKKDGVFLFDVFTANEFNQRKVSRLWEYENEGGFWSEEPYLCLEAFWEYDNDVKLEQYTIIKENNDIEVVRNWFKVFDLQTIENELIQQNFVVVNAFANVLGESINKESKTLCMLAKKGEQHV